VPSLLRQRVFRLYWSAQSISMLGDQITGIALPLVGVITLNASPAQMGVLTALVWAPNLVLGLHAGALADRWGRRPTMIAGGILSAIGFVVYSTAGTFWQVIAGAGIRALGASLIWPAATAWMAESMPRRRHGLYMGLFGEFENVGITIGPILGGVAWSLAGIQAAFYTYAVAALLASLVAAIFVKGRSTAAPATGTPEATTTSGLG
jgi:MFS family permease